MSIAQGKEDGRPASRVGARIWFGVATSLWLGLNVALGVAAAYPIGYAATLIAYLSGEHGGVHHPQVAVLGHLSPFAFDSDEVEIVAAGILFGFILVLAFFGAVNVGLRALLRRWPGLLYWTATVLLFLLPSLWFWR